MSQLYVRVLTSFYSHRKTAKLRYLIGDDAFWVVPRLWSYAAENQPDGDLSQYESGQIAMLLECSKHATSIKQALIDSGFVDPDGRIHDWAEHNGYHDRFAERARTAAKVRWAKQREENPPLASPPEGGEGKRTVDSGDKHCCEHATSIDQAFSQFWGSYPKRVGKGAAEKSFRKMGCYKFVDKILIAIEDQKKSPDWVKDAGQFIPHASTWLNQKRWEDEVGVFMPSRRKGPNI